MANLGNLSISVTPTLPAHQLEQYLLGLKRQIQNRLARESQYRESLERPSKPLGGPKVSILYEEIVL